MKSDAYLLDTNILIDYLRGSIAAKKFIEKATDNNCYISTITITELYAGVREGKERALLTRLIHIFNIATLDHKIAESAGLLCKQYRKSHGTDLAVSIIAATAQSLNAKLATLNTKHFPMFKGLKKPY